jgi:hypothetical protein
MTLFLGISQSNADEALGFRSVFICNASEVIDEQITNQFDEVPLAEGDALIYSEGLEKYAPGVLTIYVHRDKLTFSVVIEFPDDVSCIVSVGENFRPFVSRDDAI